MEKMDVGSLAHLYNQPVPRYTSYPTVPFWQTPFDVNTWKRELVNEFQASNIQSGISLYIHLPFCESLCTYCGCNKKITTNHSVEFTYLDAIKKEWQLYLDLLPQKPVIRELHLGGGTPTFFSPENLERLMQIIFAGATRHPQHEFSIEAHPNNTTVRHLEVLHALGFRRLSFGVQDNDAEVQRIINRIQPWENVVNGTQQARSIGFESVNYDLVYGLPKQTLAGLTNTVEHVIGMKPDRIAFYSYAHVPWTSRGQRLFDENDLPSADEKMQLYLQGRAMLSAAGYADIGMDHYALPGDTLYEAWKSKTLHRNFMGYTTQHTQVMIGLGVSSISDAGTAYAQNTKALHEYYEMIDNNLLPVFKGFELTKEDRVFKRHILDICCTGSTRLLQDYKAETDTYSQPVLHKLAADGLVEMNGDEVTVTAIGRNFIRNIAAAFDLRLQRKGTVSDKPMFSKAI